MSFTKGPWILDEGNRTDCLDDECPHEFLSVLEADRTLIAEVYVSKNGCEPPEVGEANARLISAAPDLYHACREMLANIDHWLITGNPADAAESKRLHDLMEAAVELADGKGAGE